MKYLPLLFILISKMSFATVLEVLPSEKKVYFFPTPTLEVNLQDLDEAGGWLSLELKYDGSTVDAEMNEIRNQHKGYELVQLTPESVGSAKFEIANIFTAEFVMGPPNQVGPRLNNSESMLTVEQMKAIRKLGSKWTHEVRFSYPGKLKYTTQQIVETYKTGPRICDTMSAKNISELLWQLGQLKKPDSIKYDQTFFDLKLMLLIQCFSLTPAKVNSFADVMNLSLQKLNVITSIEAEYKIKSEVEKKLDVLPEYKFTGP